MVEVTQEDREAAARWAKSNSRHAQAANMKRGSCDKSPLVQAFAAHRTATLQRVIDLANACVDQGLPLTAFVPMLEDMR